VSVLRTCAALGFDGFLPLKVAFREHMQQRGRDLPPQDVIPGAPNGESEEWVRMLRQIARDESAHLSELLSALNPSMLFDEARSMLKAEEVVIFGHSVSKVFADYFCHRLNYLRIKAFSVSLEENSTVQSILSRLTAKDHVIMFSFPPYHQPAINTVKYAMQQGVGVTVITDSLDSSAAMDGTQIFICNTSTHFFYNSHTLVMTLANLVASCAAMELGEKFSDILLEEQAVEIIRRLSDSDSDASARSEEHHDEANEGWQ
jgi:DNA-binding MurR/RpiR family transcriptional regulator